MDKNQISEIQKNFITICESIGDKSINSFTSNRIEGGIYKVQLTEIGLNRFVNKHTKDGYIIISANRKATTSEQVKDNKDKTKELENDIRGAGYSFIPVDGGTFEWEEDAEGNEIQNTRRPVIEKSFIVPVTKRDKTVNINELFNLGKLWATKYKQNDFLFTDGTKTACYDGQGEITLQLSNNLTLNDKVQKYFTKLKGNDKTNQADRRFTFENQIYFHGRSDTYMTDYRRHLSGEIQLW